MNYKSILKKSVFFTTNILAVGMLRSRDPWSPAFVNRLMIIWKKPIHLVSVSASTRFEKFALKQVKQLYNNPPILVNCLWTFFVPPPPKSGKNQQNSQELPLYLFHHSPLLAGLLQSILHQHSVSWWLRQPGNYIFAIKSELNTSRLIQFYLWCTSGGKKTLKH